MAMKFRRGNRWLTAVEIIAYNKANSPAIKAKAVVAQEKAKEAKEEINRKNVIEKEIKEEIQEKADKKEKQIVEKKTKNIGFEENK